MSPMWTCACDVENAARVKVCTSCGARKPKPTRLEVVSPSPSWRPGGPRPCTDVENKAAIEIIQAVLAKRMTVAEAEAHLHTIFGGAELP